MTVIFVLVSLLPIVPYYAPEKIASSDGATKTIVNPDCVVVATATGTVPDCDVSTTSTLQKNITRLADTILKKTKPRNISFTQKKQFKIKKIKLMAKQHKSTFLDNIKKAFKKIRLTTDTDDAPKQFTGGVNIAQRLCYNSSSMLFKERSMIKHVQTHTVVLIGKKCGLQTIYLRINCALQHRQVGDMILIMLPLIQQALKSQAIVQAVTPIIDICCQVTVTVLQ